MGTTFFRRLLFLSLFALPVGFQAQAQVFKESPLFDPSMKIMDQIYNLEFEEASNSIAQLKTQYPEHPGPHFLDAHYGWWKAYVMQTNVTFFDEIDAQLNLVLKKNKAFKNNEAEKKSYLFFQFMAYMLKTRVAVLEEKWLKAASSGRKVVPLLKQTIKYADEAPEFKFGTGMYHYYAGTYQEGRPWVKPFMRMFPSGDGALGLQEMQESAELPSMTQVEAWHYLSDIYLENRIDVGLGLKYAEKVTKKYPSNAWLASIYLQGLLLNGKYELLKSEAKQHELAFSKIDRAFHRSIDSDESNYTTVSMMRIFHYHGRALLEQGQYEEALKYFKKSYRMSELAHFELHYVVPANAYYAGICYDRIGNRDAAMEAYQQVLSMRYNEPFKKQAKECLDLGCE